jgi:hypothetical protein
VKRIDREFTDRKVKERLSLNCTAYLGIDDYIPCIREKASVPPSATLKIIAPIKCNQVAAMQRYRTQWPRPESAMPSLIRTAHWDTTHVRGDAFAPHWQWSYS